MYEEASYALNLSSENYLKQLILIKKSLFNTDFMIMCFKIICSLITMITQSKHNFERIKNVIVVITRKDD